MGITRRGACGWGVWVLLLIIVVPAIPAFGQSLEEAERLRSQALKLYWQGRYQEAIPLAQRALGISEKALPDPNPWPPRGSGARTPTINEKALRPSEYAIARSLNVLATLYASLGDYVQAEPLFKRDLAILEKVQGKEHPEVAQSLNDLAILYASLGDYVQAEPLYLRALAIFEQAQGKKHPDVATILNNLAGLYQALGRYSEAEPLYLRALAIGKFTQKDYLSDPGMLNTLAKLHLDSGKDNLLVVASLNNLALLYLESGRLEEGFRIFKQRGNSWGLGRYYLLTKAYPEAEREFRRSQAIEREEPDFQITKYVALGLSLEGQGNYKQAGNYFLKAIELIERQWSTLTLSARQHFLAGKVGAGFFRLEPYEGMVRVLIKERKSGYEKEALLYAERVKSRTFLELLAGRGVKGRRPADQQVLAQDREHQQKLTELTQRLSVLQGLGPKAPQGEAKRLQQELEQRQAEYERFLNEVKLKDLEVASLIGAEAIAIEQLQSLLDPDTTLLEYYTAKDRLYAWLVRRDAIQVQELPLSQKALEKEVNDLLLPNISNRSRAAAPKITLPIGDAHTKESAPQERERNRTQFTQKTEVLYQKLLAPLLKSITTKQILVVPHGVLHKLPFAALGDQQGLLIDKHSLSVLPALSVLQYIVTKRNPDHGRLLALANPVLDYVPGYADLAGAEAEVKQVSQHFKEKAVYRGREATEGLLRRTSANADVIHLAVHGEFNDRQPLQSGLLLAKDLEYNGPLQVHELFDLNLEGVNLVVASACETALSRIQGGDDLVGLSRGFIYAGTPSLIATLWKVDDASTAQLMARFYENWREKKMSKAEALRQAQQTLRAMPAYRHPYYWAPFILVGDWQ